MMTLGLIVIGAITGFIARDGFEARGAETVGDVCVGAVGAVIGGWILAQFVSPAAAFIIPLNIAAAIVGALVTLKAYRVAKARA